MAEQPAQRKYSHSQVEYEDVSKRADERCAECRHFIASIPGRCEIVKPPIYRNGWCMEFEAKAKKQ